MKKNILILAIAILCSTFSITFAYADGIQTDSNVLVDGAPKSFEAYNIAGNNYFKLRDIAFVLRNTNKKFEVKWDKTQDAISITTGQSYTNVGSEMKFSKKTAKKTATVTNSKIYVDGKKISLTAYNIDGNNYFKLRDLGASIDFGIDWNANANTVEITSTKVYIPLVAKKVNNKSNDMIELLSMNDGAKLSELYTIDGTGEYSGYKRLMGYPGSDKYAIYFKSGSSSYRVSVVDLRDLDENYKVTWKYNGRTIKSTRKECNNFFSDLSKAVSTEWLENTFGQIYLDWLDMKVFTTSDAEKLVDRYLKSIERAVLKNRFVNSDES